jgi:hypothetical protein
MTAKSPSQRACEDCGVDVVGKLRRRRCDRCYRAVLRREQGIPQRLTAGPNPTMYVLANSIPAQGGCVYFTGWTTRGYARVNLGEGRRAVSAHRLVYESLIGPVPEGLQLDHVCHTRSTACVGGVACPHRRCVNPHHLEPVTTQENTRRAIERPGSTFNKHGKGGPGRKPSDFCHKGHPMTPDNLLWEKRSSASDKKRRRCKECARAYQRARWKRLSAKG